MNIEPKNIQQTIYSLLNINNDNAIKHPKNRELSNANWISIYFIWRFRNESLNTIGKYFGHKNHSTVHHGLKLINKAMNGYNQELKEKLLLILNHYNLEFKPYKNNKYEQI